MTKINLTIERILDMDDREMYDLSDLYVKGRFSRLAVDPRARSVLSQRDKHSSDRDPDYDQIFEGVREQVYRLLYSDKVLPRHYLALQRMQRNVETQLEDYADNHEWRRGAQGFLNLVKDELARVEVMLAERRESSAEGDLERLLRAIGEHREAEDADEADERLWAIADELVEKYSFLATA